MSSDGLRRVLCVDDEQAVLDGLRLTLRRHYDVHTATSAQAGLDAIESGEPFVIILSDMRMPGMNGAQFLARVREQSPDSVRILLTGHSELESAIAAINEGRIFRFLLKPCDSMVLINAFEDATAQHDLAQAEKVLLEQTLRGAVEALGDLLALSSPLAAARTELVRQMVAAVAERMDKAGSWELDLAAMLSHVGSVTLDPELAQRCYNGSTIDHVDRERIKAMPEVAGRLLGHIPRLDGVVWIVRHQMRSRRRQAFERFSGVELDRYVGAMILKAVNDHADLVASGMLPAHAVGRMEATQGVYEPSVLRALASITGSAESDEGFEEVNVTALEVGMVLAEDLHLKNGMLLVAEGSRVTRSLVATIDNGWSRIARQVVRIRVRRVQAA